MIKIEEKMSNLTKYEQEQIEKQKAKMNEAFWKNDDLNSRRVGVLHRNFLKFLCLGRCKATDGYEIERK